jgi:hypothetical protein
VSGTIRPYRKIMQTVDAAEYDGRAATAKEIVDWVRGHQGTAFMAAELGWRHDMGTYWHKEHGFIYLPAGARAAGGQLERLRDDEIVVRTGGGTYALVFPGDFVVRSRSGFYPLRAESFHRSHVPNVSRRGTGPLSPPPP